MKLTLKNIIRIITLLPLCIYLMYCSYQVIEYGTKLTYIDSGIVVSKSNDEMAIKYGSKTLLYLNVQFKESGFRSVECNPTTYFSKKVGDRVSFKLDKEVNSFEHSSSIIGVITLAGLVVGLVLSLIFYLMSNEENKLG